LLNFSAGKPKRSLALDRKKSRTGLGGRFRGKRRPGEWGGSSPCLADGFGLAVAANEERRPALREREGGSRIKARNTALNVSRREHNPGFRCRISGSSYYKIGEINNHSPVSYGLWISVFRDLSGAFYVTDRRSKQ